MDFVSPVKKKRKAQVLHFVVTETLKEVMATRYVNGLSYLLGTGAPFSSNSLIAHQPHATSPFSPVDYNNKIYQTHGSKVICCVYSNVHRTQADKHLPFFYKVCSIQKG